MESRASTEILLEEARKGDRKAFDRLAAASCERLEGLIHTRLGPSLRPKVDVDDIVQETLLRAFRSIDHFESQGDDAFCRWLGGIAGNVIHETARRHRGEFMLALDDDFPAGGVSQSKAGERNERFDRLQGALNSLSPDHRQVILLARVERRPLAVVARRMGRSPEAVSQLLWRALKKLKESFGSTDSLHLPDRRLEDRGGAR